MNRAALATASTLAIALAVTACHPKALCGDAPTSAQNAGAAGPSATRLVSEADIIQMDDAGRLYAMSKSGNVSVVDARMPSKLALLGQAKLAGIPFEMYRRGDVLITMSNNAVSKEGKVKPPAEQGGPVDEAASALVTVMDVRDASKMTTLGTFPIPGEIADSRIVGNVLYVVTYRNGTCFSCTVDRPETTVSTFNLADPAALRPIDQVSLASEAPLTEVLAWGMGWKRSIVATASRLYVGGHADFDPRLSDDPARKEGIIDVLDITDPTGHLHVGARIKVTGPVLSRWQMDEKDGVLRVVSQRGIGRTGNGFGMPAIETFRMESTDVASPLGTASLRLPRQEGLRTVRFDGHRGYAITFNQTDPLFTLDLSDPAMPVQKGELEMPGWIFHLEPRGDRLIGLGVDRRDPGGSLNVSLFDVSDMAAPQLLAREAFGARLPSDHAILEHELPETQDRIQKAFRVFDDGLIAMPISATWSDGGNCKSEGSGIQLLSWNAKSLEKRDFLQVDGNPRRAFELQSHMVAVSDSNVRSFSIAAPDFGKQASDLVLGGCVDPQSPHGLGGYDGAMDGHYGGACGD
jgi:hypothetical protein